MTHPLQDRTPEPATCAVCLNVGEATYRDARRQLVVYPCHACRPEEHKALLPALKASAVEPTPWWKREHTEDERVEAILLDLRLHSREDTTRVCAQAGNLIQELRASLSSSQEDSEPMQPIVMDHGVARFRKNAIVAFLLDAGPFDMNALPRIAFSKQDRDQFAQLIGYSVSGYGELSYVDDRRYDRASELAANLRASPPEPTALFSPLLEPTEP